MWGRPIEWQPYDWSSGSTHPGYVSFGAPLWGYISNVKTPSEYFIELGLTFEEAQKWVADACANCLMRGDLSGSWIKCLQRGWGNSFNFVCDSYVSDENLSKARSTISNILDWNEDTKWDSIIPNLWLSI